MSRDFNFRIANVSSRKAVADSKFNEMFGAPSDNPGSVAKSNIEGIRSGRESIKSMKREEKSRYEGDNTAGLKYRNSQTQEVVDASTLLVGRITRCNPPAVFIKAGVSWHKEA